jgi:hypothetical protein
VKKYRLFVQDVGISGYSGLYDVQAASSLAARKLARDEGRRRRAKVLALPHDRRELWPDGQTGEVPRAALEFSD